MLSINYPRHADLFTLRLLAFLLRRHQDNPNAVREALSNPLIVKRGGQERESMFEVCLGDERLSLGPLSSQGGKSKADVTVYWPDHGAPLPRFEFKALQPRSRKKTIQTCFCAEMKPWPEAAKHFFEQSASLSPKTLKIACVSETDQQSIVWGYGTSMVHLSSSSANLSLLFNGYTQLFREMVMGKINCQGSMEHIALLADEGLNQGIAWPC